MVHREAIKNAMVLVVVFNLDDSVEFVVLAAELR
jgi:hypothetical protein